MNHEAYEIEHCLISSTYRPSLVDGEKGTTDSHIAYVNMLTGLPVEELYERIPQRLLQGSGWYGRDFIEVFRSLGYNCSPRFIPFDKDTPYPCLLRYRPTKAEVARAKQRGEKRPDWWGVEVYNQGLVYCPWLAAPFALEQFNPDMKITSMLQVWIAN